MELRLSLAQLAQHFSQMHLLFDIDKYYSNGYDKSMITLARSFNPLLYPLEKLSIFERIGEGEAQISVPNGAKCCVGEACDTRFV